LDYAFVLSAVDRIRHAVLLKLSERIPAIFFGRLDCEKHPEVASKYGVKRYPVFLLFQGIDKIEQIDNPDLNAIESAVSRHNGLVNDPGCDEKAILVIPWFGRDDKIVGPSPFESFKFGFKLVGSPAQGFTWKFVPQRLVLCPSPPIYEGTDNTAPDKYGTQGVFLFQLEYLPQSDDVLLKIPLRFEYWRPWMPFKEPVEVFETELTFAAE